MIELVLRCHMIPQVYRGSFVDGTITGVGSYNWPDGSTYTGEVRLNQHNFHHHAYFFDDISCWMRLRVHLLRRGCCGHLCAHKALGSAANFELRKRSQTVAWLLDRTDGVSLVCTPLVFISHTPDRTVSNVDIDRWIVERGMALGCLHALLERTMERGCAAKETGR